MSSAPQPRQVLLPACLLPAFCVSLVISFSSMRSLFPTLSHVLYCCFCFQALANFLWVKSALPSFLSLLFSAVLPVCRAPYFTPTGTNSPYCSNVCHLKMLHAFISICWRISCNIYSGVVVFFFPHQWQQDFSIIQHCCCSPLFYIQNWDRPLLSIRLLTYLFFHRYVIPAAVVMNLMFMAENLPPPFILSSCQSQPSPHNRDMCSFSP